MISHDHKPNRNLYLQEDCWKQVIDDSDFPPYDVEVWGLFDQIVIGSDNIKPSIIKCFLERLPNVEHYFGMNCQFVCTEQGPFENIVIDGNRYEIIAWRPIVP